MDATRRSFFGHLAASLLGLVGMAAARPKAPKPRRYEAFLDAAREEFEKAEAEGRAWSWTLTTTGPEELPDDGGRLFVLHIAPKQKQATVSAEEPWAIAPNEVRALHGRPPYKPAGDDPLTGANVVPVPIGS